MAQTPQRTSVLQVVSETGHKDKHVHWADMEQVRASLSMPPNGKPKEQSINLTEKKFEILSQEALFNFRLRSLLKVFPMHKLTEVQKKKLFDSTDKILNLSDKLVTSLDELWQTDIYLAGIFERIKKHEKMFEIYTEHFSNQKSTLKYYTKLKAENKDFSELFDQWQNCPENYSKMNYESYYNLPKERLISLTKTCEHVLSLMEKKDEELKTCQQTVKILKRLTSKLEQSLPVEKRHASPILKIIDNLEFSAGMEQIPLAVSARELILEDDLTLLKLSGSSVSKRSLRHVILFNDLLLITRRIKREERPIIVDYCYRKSLELKNFDDFLEMMKGSSLADSHDKLLALKLHHNHEEKSVVMLFSCADAARCAKWQKQLVKHIENNKPRQSVLLPVPDIVVHVEEPTDNSPQLVHPPVVLRANQEDPFINELKRKQEALKRDSRVPSEVLDEYDMILDGTINNDIADVETGAFLIPRPEASKATAAPPPVPAKPHKLSVEESTKPVFPPKVEHDQTGVISFDSSLEYPPGMSVFPLLSASRWKVLEGEATLRWHNVDKKHSESKTLLFVVLFNDVLFITKRKGNRLKVLTYGFRNLVDMTLVKPHPHLPTKLKSDRSGKFMMSIHFLENYKLLEETLIVSLGDESKREGWLKAIPSPPPVDDGGDRQYDSWDSPLVVVTTSYEATGPHQLRLVEKEKYQVTRRRADGWYEGQRVSDGEMGLILISCTKETQSQHLHASEVRQSLSRK